MEGASVHARRRLGFRLKVVGVLSYPLDFLDFPLESQRKVKTKYHQQTRMHTV